VQADHHLVELLDESGRAGASGRVAVTDLHNHAMPFIRSLNGDLATAAAGACACGRGLPRLAAIEGRSADVLRAPGGGRVPGVFFPHVMKDVAGVERFQAVQTRLDEIRLRIVPREGFERGPCEDFVQREVRRAFGEGVRVVVETVADIPLTPSGKRRVVVCELPEDGR
jgi:phenylacetate-CoA ligase